MGVVIKEEFALQATTRRGARKLQPFLPYFCLPRSGPACEKGDDHKGGNVNRHHEWPFNEKTFIKRQNGERRIGVK